MRSALWPLATFVGSLAIVSGCVEPFDGTHIELTLNNIKPPCEQLVTSKFNAKACASSTDTTTYYYEVWAVFHRSIFTRVGYFTIRPVISVAELLELETSKATLANGKTYFVDPDRSLADYKKVGDYDAFLATLNRLSEMMAITSYSPQKWSKSKQLSSTYYVGNWSPVVKPRNGVLIGVVDGLHPLGQGAFVGGGTFDTDILLKGLDGLFISMESKSPNRKDPTPSTHIVMSGSAEQLLRGTTTVKLTSTSGAGGVFSLKFEQDEREYF